MKMLFHLKVTVHQICDFVLSLWEKIQVGLNFFWPVYALNFQLIACCMLDSGKRDHQPSGPLVLLSRNMTKPTKSPVCTAKAVINLGIHAVRSVFAVCLQWKLSFTWQPGERGGSVVECRTPEREVRGSRPTAAVLCPWARHFTPRKYWLITQEAMAPSRYDWKIVDWDVKPQYNQKNLTTHRFNPFSSKESDSNISIDFY